jgi:hypothetical protein
MIVFFVNVMLQCLSQHVHVDGSGSFKTELRSEMRSDFISI